MQEHGLNRLLPTKPAGPQATWHRMHMHPPGRLKCFLATAVTSLPKVARSAALTSRSASEGGKGSGVKQLVWSSSEDIDSPTLPGGKPTANPPAGWPASSANRLPAPHSQVRSLSCSHRRTSLEGSPL